MINGIIIVALIVVAIFAVKGSIRQFTYGCCGTKDVEKKIKVQDKNASDYPYYAVIGVDGMKCKHCKLHVENAFYEKDDHSLLCNTLPKSLELINDVFLLPHPASLSFLKSVFLPCREPGIWSFNRNRFFVYACFHSILRST